MRNFVSATIGFVFLTFSSHAFSGDAGAGEKRYAVNCGNCHGPGGMGLAGYPKISGQRSCLPNGKTKNLQIW